VTSSRITNTLAIGLLAVLGVSACTSDPSPQRIAEDLVKTLAQDHPEIEECMLEVVESYDLNELGKNATNENPEISDPAQAELDEFEAELAACDPEGVTRTSTP
jgi:uncharacterized lipoprotein